MTIEALNALDRANFVETVGWVFEHSPWVAERAWAARPFPNVDALHGAMVDQVEHASAEEQLALLRAHPDLGTRARVSDASAAEQAGAGLDQLTSTEFERLLALNQAYRDRFGFPFLFAVKGSTKHDILNALDRRVSSSRDEKYRVALTGLIATDSMKNFIQRETLNYDGPDLEQYCHFLASKFLGIYPLEPATHSPPQHS